jgi:3-oxoacyl-[acyl-carrier protein] reductase
VESGILAGKSVFVTGASRGIGAAIGRLAARHGAAVALNYRTSRNRGEALAAELRAGGARAMAIGADVSDPAACARAIGQAAKEFGPVDVLVHNAYPGWSGGPLEELEWPVYQRFLDGMLRPAVELSKLVLPAMKARRWGRIVLLGSTSMYELNDQHTAYLAGKGALLAMMRGLAREVGRDGVTVNMVSPSLVWTGDGAEPPEFGAVHRERSAAGRLPTADEVAGAVLFLASDLASGITGAQIPVSCGSPMHVG